MRVHGLEQKDLLRLIDNSAGIAAVLPLHLPRLGFAVYFIYVFHIFNLWNADLQKETWKDHLSQVILFLSGIAGLMMLLFSPDFPLWSMLFCIMLLGQVALVYVGERMRGQFSPEETAMFRICRWVLTAMDLLVLGVHIYMIAGARIGTIQGSVSFYDMGTWTSLLMDVPRLIVGICIAVDTYRFCKEYRREA